MSPSKVFLKTFEQKKLSIHHINSSAIATVKVSVCTSVKLVAAGSANSLLKTNQIVLKRF